MIAELRAAAGFSPICEAVLAQMEHCAAASAEKSSKKIIETNKINPHFFMKQI